MDSQTDHRADVAMLIADRNTYIVSLSRKTASQDLGSGGSEVYDSEYSKTGDSVNYSIHNQHGSVRLQPCRE